MNTTQMARSLLDPEAYRMGRLRPPTENEFAALRERIDQLETEQAAGIVTGRDAATSRGAQAPAESQPAGDPVTATVTAPSPRRKRGSGRSTMSTQTTAVQNTNAPTFNDLLQVATDLGTQAGQGKDTQIKFDLKVLEAAYLGVINLDPNKHGTDRRDGIVLAETYAKAQNTALIFDQKAPNQRKLISNVDKCIKLGGSPKWGQGEPLATVNQLVTLRQTLRKDPVNAKKLDDAHNMLMRFATKQLKQDTLIDGDELKAFCFKRDPNLRSAEDVIEGIRKVCNNLKVGKVSNCPDMDTSPEIQAIINACTKRLTAIAKARGAGQAGGTV